jgi:plasmid maintenance system antidote protein VapI
MAASLTDAELLARLDVTVQRISLIVNDARRLKDALEARIAAARPKAKKEILVDLKTTLHALEAQYDALDGEDAEVTAALEAEMKKLDDEIRAIESKARCGGCYLRLGNDHRMCIVRIFDCSVKAWRDALLYE